MTAPRTTKNAVRGIINIGRRIGTIFRNLAKFAADNCGPWILAAVELVHWLNYPAKCKEPQNEEED